MRFLKFMLLVLMVIMPFAHIFANSGPIYISEAPAYEMLLLEDCPIVVESEKLTFDISETQRDSWSPRAFVTADYKMNNPYTEDQTVRMAFPFVWTLGTTSSGGPSGDIARVTVDGDAIPFTMIIGENLSGQDFHRDPELFYQAADMQNVLDKINASAYNPQTFNDSIGATVYTLTLRSKDKYESLNVVVSFTMDTASSWIIENGFNGYSIRDNSSVEFSTWHYFDSERNGSDIQETNFLVIGDDTINDLEIKVYADGYKEGEVTDVDAYFEKTDVTAYEYIHEHIINPEIEEQRISELVPVEQLYGVIARYLDSVFGGGQPVTSADEAVMSIRSGNFMSLLVYEVSFPAKSSVNAAVSYSCSATMDKRNSADKFYTYAYVLNPARNYAEFGTLEIEIIPPPDLPYITSSTLPLQRREDGAYFAVYDSLPENDLVFTLYSKSEVDAPAVAVSGTWWDRNYFFLYTAGLSAIIGFFAAKLWQVRRKSKHEEMD